MRFIRLFLFHVKDYLSDQYFVWLTITSTTSIFLMQYIMAYATHNLNNTQNMASKRYFWNVDFLYNRCRLHQFRTLQRNAAIFIKQPVR